MWGLGLGLEGRGPCVNVTYDHRVDDPGEILELMGRTRTPAPTKLGRCKPMAFGLRDAFASLQAPSMESI